MLFILKNDKIINQFKTKNQMSDYLEDEFYSAEIDDTDYDWNYYYNLNPLNTQKEMNLTFNQDTNVLTISSASEYAAFLDLQAQYESDYPFEAYISDILFHNNDWYLFVDFNGVSYKKVYSKYGKLMKYVNGVSNEVYECNEKY
jgi:hypothetical protein